MLNAQKISIIIPCFNEAEALPTLLEKIPQCITEVIVVDNCSTDNSAEIAKRFSATVINEPVKGYGAALRAGIQQAKGDIIILLDGDGTYPLQDVEKALLVMEDKNLDFLSGCRFPLSGSQQTMPLINKLANHFISGLITLLFRIHLKDSQSGLMLFKKHLGNEIHIENKGMGFSQELKIRAWLTQGAHCGETHIQYNIRIGQSKFRKIIDGLSNFFDLLSLYFKIGCRPRGSQNFKDEHYAR